MQVWIFSKILCFFPYKKEIQTLITASKAIYTCICSSFQKHPPLFLKLLLRCYKYSFLSDFALLLWEKFAFITSISIESSHSMSPSCSVNWPFPIRSTLILPPRNDYFPFLFLNFYSSKGFGFILKSGDIKWL